MLPVKVRLVALEVWCGCNEDVYFGPMALFFYLLDIGVYDSVLFFSEVKIKEVSTTKRTVVMDQGLLDGAQLVKVGFFSSSKPYKNEKSGFW